MALFAQVPGRCANCGGRIDVGDPFAWGSAQGQRIHTPGCPDTVANAIAAPAEVVHTPSPEQQAIYDALLYTIDNIQVKAMPGSGKTYTSVQGVIKVHRAYPDANIVSVAFNAKIARDSAKKMPRGVEVRTFHSLWFAVLQSHLNRKLNINKAKLRGILNDLVKTHIIDRETAKQYGSGAIKLVGFAKNAGLGVPGVLKDTDDAWVELFDRFDLSFEGKDTAQGITLAQRLLELNNVHLHEVDFDDMLYLPAILGAEGMVYEYVFVDEAQDFNGLQRHLLSRMLDVDSRLIAVGDENQSIYAFRGADSDSMDLIAGQFNCTQYPLSVSYRCPQAVVREAQRLVAEIQASPDAIEGIVASLTSWKLRDFRATDLVLCRNSAPLVELAYKCLGAQVPCQVLGREIGQGLITLINKMEAVDLEDLQQRLADYSRIEIARLLLKDEEDKAQALEDKVQSIDAAISGLPGDTDKRTIDLLIATIDSVFSDVDEHKLTLSTVHKAKGAEAPRVFILDRALMPSRHAKTAQALRQERNIEFVAITRAQEELYWLPSLGIK